MATAPSNRLFQIQDYITQIFSFSKREGLSKITQDTVGKVLAVHQTTVGKFLKKPSQGILSQNFESKFSQEVSTWPSNSNTIGRTLKKIDAGFFLNITIPTQPNLNLSPVPQAIQLMPPVAPMPTIQTNEEEENFVYLIKKIIKSDPNFSNPVYTSCQLLDVVKDFLDQGGNPALTIPEIKIGTSCLRNISCLELLYRIFYCDIKGFKSVFWDNLGSHICKYFTTVIERCLEVVDTLTEIPNLSTGEIVALIQCVHASDPTLYRGKITGNRILRLMEKFLESKGDPLLFISNVKIGDERVDKLTIYELIYLLWKHPHETDLEEGDWDYEDNPINELDDEDQDNDEPVNNRPNGTSINDHFRDILNRCFTVIQYELSYNLVKDESFLSLMRCVVEFSEDSPSDTLTSEKTGEKFLHLMRYFVARSVNPNLLFLKIQIDGNVYLNATCFQVFYLFWKKPNALWTDLQEKEFQRLFEKIVYDRRTDLTLKFSERSLTTHHFVNSGNITFYHKQHATEKKCYTNGGYEPDERAIDQLHGHSLERMTIAHYAVILNDYTMLNWFLDLEPRLLSMTCCVTKGKATVDSHRYIIHSQEGAVKINSLEENDQLSGIIPIRVRKPFADLQLHIQLVRATNVTLLHLAARIGREGVLAILGSRHPDPSITDSDNKTPQDYLKLSIIEGIVEKNRSSQEMFRALTLITKCNSFTALPEVNKLFHHEGYDLFYNTSRKVAIFAHQRLSKDSFGKASRTNNWKEDPTIPSINRASKKDFKSTGFDRGHLAPAEDATGSENTMAATFRLENAVPQNPNLNSGVWSRLEAHVRELARENDLAEVFTGPLFLPEAEVGVIKHGVMGKGEVHIPTHLFKVIYIHNRDTTKEIYIIPNQTNSDKKHFSDFRCDEKLDFIQQHSGILFSKWARN